MRDLWNRACEALARRLAPDVARDAERYRYMRNDLDEARWWLSNHFNEPATLAQFILNRDANRWSEPQGHGLGLPPGYVNQIGDFRQWLGTKPFAEGCDSVAAAQQIDIEARETER